MMAALRRIVFAAVLAGLVGGLVVTLLRAVAQWPLIAQAEVFEKAGEAAAPPAVHDHAAYQHAVAWEPVEGIKRISYTVLANVVAATAFALLLVAGFALHGSVTPWSGALWGLAGYLAFALAPALGLPPELPGAEAADLVARQTWWLATAAGTAGGLALLAFARPLWLRLSGLLPILLPHLIGAPVGAGGGPVPEALTRQFIAASLIVGLVFWLTLGVTGAIAFWRLRPAAA